MSDCPTCRGSYHNHSWQTDAVKGVHIDPTAHPDDPNIHNKIGACISYYEHKLLKVNILTESVIIVQVFFSVFLELEVFWWPTRNKAIAWKYFPNFSRVMSWHTWTIQENLRSREPCSIAFLVVPTSSELPLPWDSMRIEPYCSGSYKHIQHQQYHQTSVTTLIEYCSMSVIFGHFMKDN